MSIRPGVRLAPQIVTVEVALEPVYNALSSMMILNNIHVRSGFDKWIYDVANQLSEEQLYHNRTIFWGMGHDALYRIFDKRDWSDFPAYLKNLRNTSPDDLRDRIAQLIFVDNPQRLKRMIGLDVPDAAELMADLDLFVDYLQHAYNSWNEHNPDDKQKFDAILQADKAVHQLMQDSHEFHQIIVNHLTDLWDAYFEAEWHRNLPELKETVAAYQQIDYTGLTIYEAMLKVTGRDLTTIIEDEDIARVDRIIFTPSPHSGPYVGWSVIDKLLYLDFGARMPPGVVQGSATMSEAELLMVLNALDDEVRLGIMKLLARRDQLCSQDIIEYFDLSQSTASRHLRQLSATRIVEERRTEGAKKCYTLNRSRIAEVRETLGNLFLED